MNQAWSSLFQVRTSMQKTHNGQLFEWSLPAINTTLIVGGGETWRQAVFDVFLVLRGFYIALFEIFHQNPFWQRYFVTDCRHHLGGPSQLLFQHCIPLFLNNCCLTSSEISISLSVFYFSLLCLLWQPSVTAGTWPALAQGTMPRQICLVVYVMLLWYLPEFVL